MNDLVSEFFIDIITRIIPGFVVLALYPDKLFHTVFLKFQNTPLLLIPGLIGAAWVIGFAIEQATYLLGAYPVRILLPKTSKVRKSLIGDRELVSTTENEDFKFWRRHRLKQAGERIFFRVACAISVLTWICPPSLSLLQDDRWPKWHEIIPIYSALGMLVFGAAWLWVVIPPADSKPTD
jgi:hypothetical protein